MFLRCAFFKTDMILLLLFFIARIVLKRKPFSRVVQDICGKYCKVASRSTSSYHKVDWLSSYFHAYHDEILTEAFFFFFFFFFAVRLP